MSGLFAGIIGATGLVGEGILKAADQSSSYSKITTITRRPLKIDVSDKVESVIEGESVNWKNRINELEADTKVFFSAFGTTRAAAGGNANFKKIDYGVNYAAAKAAKEKGVETYVLISTLGASTTSIFSVFPYFYSKGKLEDDITALKFQRTIIIRPGILLGPRERPMAPYIEKFGGMIYNTLLGRVVSNPVYGDEVGKVAVHLASQPLKETNEPEVRIVSGHEILTLSREIVAEK